MSEDSSTWISSSKSSQNVEIMVVSKSESERLLGKFFDASKYDFDYDQSSLWSPPLCRRNAFLDSPIISRSDPPHIFCKLKNPNKSYYYWLKRLLRFSALWCS